ncbi:MAG: PTS sugar transporter subunit IIA [Verrucomicrobiales bacterium]|nr:PTS sugar transporter subunit IIA [Verrucomicrobiales bacterium]
MHLADILSSAQIIPEMRATNRWEAIDELVEQLVAAGRVPAEHRQDIAAVVKKREQSMSTGIGFGVGIPHAVSDLISEVVGVLGRSSSGMQFEALDNQPVKLVILFLVPQGQFQKHLHTLSNIAKNLHNADFRNALATAPDAEAIYRVIASMKPGK